MIPSDRDLLQDRRQLVDKAAVLDVTIEIARRADKGFTAWLRRWGAERGFGRLTRYRRRVRYCEARLGVSAA